MKLATLLIVLLISGCGGETRTVPKKSCSSVYTGRTDTYVQMICAGYDSKGTCTVQVPQIIESKEIVTTCTFKEWK